MKRLSVFIASFILFLIAVVASAQTWQGPTTPPPPTGTNVPAPLNVGAGAQTKQGALTVTNLTATNDVKGVRLCIGEDCQNSWPQGSTSQWVTSGSNISYTAGRVGVGAASGNAEIDIQSGSSPYWGIYQDNDTDELRFWNTSNRVIFTASGNVGIGTSTAPTHALEVVSPMNALRVGNEKAWVKVRTVESSTSVASSRISLGDGSGNEAGFISGGHTGSQNTIMIAGCDDDKNCPGATRFYDNGKVAIDGSVTIGGNVGIGPQATSPSDLLLIARDGDSGTGITIANTNTGANATRSLVLWGGSNDNYAGLYARSAAMSGSLSRALQIVSNQGAGSKIAFTVSAANRAILDDTGKFSVLTAGSTVTTGKLCFSTDGTTPAASCMTSVPSGSGGGLASVTAPLSGAGTAASPLVLSSSGCSNGWVLKWNGTAWACAADDTGTSGGLDQTTADGRYVNASGDTMTGDLKLSNRDLYFSDTTYDAPKAIRVDRDGPSILNIGNWGGAGGTQQQVRLEVLGTGSWIKASNVIVGDGALNVGRGTAGFKVGFYGGAGGAGEGFFYNSPKNALRVGQFRTPDDFNDVNIGLRSLAIGYQNAATAEDAVAIGKYVDATAANALVIGRGVSATSKLVNSTADSLMVGFGSTTPALFVKDDVYAGGTADANKVCRKDGTNCRIENDPQVGVLAVNKWCRSTDGATIICDQDAPSSGGLTSVAVNGTHLQGNGTTGSPLALTNAYTTGTVYDTRFIKRTGDTIPAGSLLVAATTNLIGIPQLALKTPSGDAIRFSTDNNYLYLWKNSSTGLPLQLYIPGSNNLFKIDGNVVASELFAGGAGGDDNKVCRKDGTNCPASGSGLTQSTADAAYLNVSGDTMTGNLTVGSAGVSNGRDVTFYGNGTGARFLWDASTKALRAGSAGSQWDEANLGSTSFAAGTDVMASGIASVALGSRSIASGNNALAAGSGVASGSPSFAFGLGTTASASSSIALGNTLTASGQGSIAIGTQSTAGGYVSMAIGNNLTNNMNESVLIGIGGGTGSTLLMTQTGIYIGSQSSANKICRSDGTDCPVNVKFPTWANNLLACDTAHPENKGLAYFNTDTNRIRVCNGTSWVQQ